MAPIQGPLMVPEALRVIKFAFSRAKLLIRTKSPSSAQSAVPLNSTRTFAQKPVAIHPSALFRQSKSPHLHADGTRSYSSTSTPPKGSPLRPKHDRSSFPSSRTSRAIAQKGLAPFASTLRPNLTGGTLSRSAGGYSLGGAGRARQFSHTSGCQAQVIQNVSAGIRAFLVNGSKARYDGVDPIKGEKRWKTLTKAQDTVSQKWEAANVQRASYPKGTSLEFQLSPTVTALLAHKSSEPISPASILSTVEEKTTTLNSPGLLQTLSSDFARAFRDLALVIHDLNKLSAFGDLPVSLRHNAQGPSLSVRFPGCDANAVSALCDEAGIRRGVILEDPAWAESRDVEMALLFPFAPADELEAGQDDEDVQQFFGARTPLYHQQQEARRWSPRRDRTRSFTTTSLDEMSASLSLGTDLSTLHFDELPTPFQSDLFEAPVSEIYIEDEPLSLSPRSFPSHHHQPQADLVPTREQDFEGVEGIYRFLSAIDDARRL